MVSIELKNDLESRSFEGFSKGAQIGFLCPSICANLDQIVLQGRAKKRFRLGDGRGGTQVRNDSWKNCSKRQCF